MMEKKLCLALTVFLIAFVYTTKALQVTNVNASEIINPHIISLQQCKMNEVLNTDMKTCEQVCDASLPKVRCLENGPPTCLCTNEYLRNHLNECVPLTECFQNTSTDGIPMVKADVNRTQIENFPIDQNISSQDLQVADAVVKNLKRNLIIFLRSLKGRSQPSSERNPRHTFPKKDSYRHYEAFLQESFKKLSGHP